VTEREERYLAYIADSLERIDEYLGDEPERFLNEHMVQDAVLRRLETLADATGKLSGELRDRHPEIPWRAVSGFRNIAAHAYTELDLQRTFEIVLNHLSPLQRVIAQELVQARAERDRTDEDDLHT
jgi:uncharacterized protein with HEPN domain